MSIQKPVKGSVEPTCLLPGEYKWTWIWIGDFNQVLSNGDKQSSTSQKCPRGSELHTCQQETEMIPLQSTRVKYTWKNKRGGDALVLEKLDRAFINNVWLHTFEHCTLEA